MGTIAVRDGLLVELLLGVDKGCEFFRRWDGDGERGTDNRLRGLRGKDKRRVKGAGGDGERRMGGIPHEKKNKETKEKGKQVNSHQQPSA